MGCTDTLSPDQADLGLRLDAYRRELHSHCWRMLRSGGEAEDAVQETLVRAWRGFDRFEGRSSLRSWLYRIATNVCLDTLQRQQRLPRPMDLVGAAEPVAGGWSEAMSAPTPVTPVAAEAADTVDPADLVASRDEVRQALVVALAALPPRQRAVLILRDVLRWRTDEVAELLGSSETSVRSALQRARTTLAAHADCVEEPGDDRRHHLLDRYVDAFERTDISSLVSLLRLDHMRASDPVIARVSAAG